MILGVDRLRLLDKEPPRNFLLVLNYSRIPGEERTLRSRCFSCYYLLPKRHVYLWIQLRLPELPAHLTKTSFKMRLASVTSTVVPHVS